MLFFFERNTYAKRRIAYPQKLAAQEVPMAVGVYFCGCSSVARRGRNRFQARSL